MNLDGKRLLVTASTGERAVADSVATLAQELGADVVPIAHEFRAAEPGGLEAFEAELEEWGGEVEGAVHVNPAPRARPRDEEASGGAMIEARRAFVANVHSLSALARAVLPLMQRSTRAGGSIVGVALSSRPAWPADEWFGGDGALEAVNRYLACELGSAGIRVNLVAAGPLLAAAPQASSGLEGFGGGTPLGWKPTDPTLVARAACFLLSDWARAVSGEVLRVYGGARAAEATARAPAQGDTPPA